MSMLTLKEAEDRAVVELMLDEAVERKVAQALVTLFSRAEHYSTTLTRPASIRDPLERAVMSVIQACVTSHMNTLFINARIERAEAKKKVSLGVNVAPPKTKPFCGEVTL